MMEISAALKATAAGVVAIGTIGGGVLTLDSRHVAQEEFDSYVSSNRVQTILSLANEAKSEGSPDYLCKALDAEFASLCTEQPDHYFCDDPQIRKDIVKKAGCD